MATATARRSPPPRPTLPEGGGVADVVLFADLANPTSNGIYQKIGFEAVADTVRFEFVTVGDPSVRGLHA